MKALGTEWIYSLYACMNTDVLAEKQRLSKLQDCGLTVKICVLI
jgi:hypothetical protein